MLKLADTNRVYKPFAKQQDAIDYAAQYNYALAQSKLDSSSQAGLVKVSLCLPCACSILFHIFAFVQADAAQTCKHIAVSASIRKNSTAKNQQQD